MHSPSIVSARDIHKRFTLGEHEIHALRGVDLDIAAGDFLVISGRSGSGKTTLLNLIGCIDYPTSGTVSFDGKSVGTLDDSALSVLRAKKIGFIFQSFNLFPVLTAIENVEYPLQLLKVPETERRKRSADALKRVGLADHFDHMPSQLSGGQRQRVAVARALVKAPMLILADEPTANLDANTAIDVLDLMAELNEREHVTFVFSSHDPTLVRRAKKVVHLSDGKIKS